MTQTTHKLVKSAFTGFILAAAMAVSAPQVFAQDSEDPDIMVDGLLSLQTDYRENGISLTGKDIAYIGNLRATHKSGVYADLFLVNMDGRLGDDLLIDGSMGYRWSGDRFDYSVSTSLKTYHGGELQSRYFPEVQATMSRDFGLFYIRGGLEYAFDGRWYAQGKEAIYSSLDVEIPVPTFPELTIISHIGYDAIKDYKNAFDWKIGLSAFYKDFEITLMLDESTADVGNASARVVAGLKWYF